MQWRPDTANDDPIFRQIIRYYEDLIIQGALLPGTSLPSERELALYYGVNRSTISAAYGELRASGFVNSVQGSSTRVSEDLWGVIPRRIPNWEQYTNGGSFLPSLPIIRRIREVSHDPQLINFAKGELAADLIPKVELNQLLTNCPLSGAAFQYEDPRGDLDLRTELAAHLWRTQAIHTTANELLITSGAQQAMLLITQCLLSPGDAVALEYPSYLYSRALFTSAGLRLYKLPMDEHGLLPDELINLYQKHKIRMVFTNPTYQNPTGATLSDERRKQLLQICSDLRIPIVEDDPYSSLTLGGAEKPPKSLISMQHGNDRVIYIGTLSKTAAPGFRLGWIVAPKTIIDRLADAKEQMDFGMGTISQQLAKLYLHFRHWENHLKKVNASLTLRRDQMLRSLEEHLRDLATWSNPQGGYYIWCKLNQPLHEKDLVEAGIENGLLFMPHSIYGADKGFIRLAFSREQEDRIDEGIQRLRKTIKSLNR